MEPNGIYYDQKEDAYYVAQKPELTPALLTPTKMVRVTAMSVLLMNLAPLVNTTSTTTAPWSTPSAVNMPPSTLGARGEFIVPDGKKRCCWQYVLQCAMGVAGFYRSDRDGHFQPLASGLRSPCGIGVSPEDELFITDNQGDWVADSCLYHIREGNFYGHPASLPAPA